MSQTILIKRSAVTVSPTSLLEGELAYSSLSKNLFIGTNAGAYIEVIGGLGQAATTAPLMNGVAAVGTGTTWSRTDHVHGSDLSRALLTTNTFLGKQSFAAPTTLSASVLIPNGADNPTTPASGDLWANAGILRWNNGTATKLLAFSDSNITGTAANVTGVVAILNGGSGSTIATGSGANVLATSPTLVTPNIGTATGTSFNLITGLAAAVPSANGVAAVGLSTLAARENHVHASDTTKANLSGAAFTGTVTVPTPINATDAVNKGYVDSLSQGLDVKQSVRVSSIVNIAIATALINASVIDGVTVVTGDRVLLLGQTLPAENGVYVVVATGAAPRAIDADTSAKVTTGMYVFVSEGTARLDTGFILTTNDTITLGTTALAFTQFSGAGQIAAGNGLSKTGNTLTINTAITADLTSTQTLSNKTFIAPALGVAIGTSFNAITGLSLTTTAPLIDGVAAAGDSTLVSRQNHVHPVDTSRVDVVLLGAINGVATLDAVGRIPDAQGPALIDAGTF